MSIIWKQNNNYILVPIQLGDISPSSSTPDISVTVSQDYVDPIRNCGLYVSPFTGKYTGSSSPHKDYEQLLWYSNNYTGCGLRVTQTYSALGNAVEYSETRMVDNGRLEDADIFSGQVIEILNGPSIGETKTILSYAPENRLFTFDTPFTNDITGADYKIDIIKQDFFKYRNGSSIDYPIQLINKAGVIDRLEQVALTFRLILPNYSKKAGNLFFDLDLTYTPTEIDNELS